MIVKKIKKCKKGHEIIIRANDTDRKKCTTCTNEKIRERNKTFYYLKKEGFRI